jgi:drug/metabolite transporter (DMT)-like permease
MDLSVQPSSEGSPAAADDVRHRSPALVDWLMLLALGTLWGSGFFFIKKAVMVFEPIQMTFLRMALSTIISLPIFFWFARSIDWTKWKSLLAIAFFGYGIPNYLFALAEQDGRVSSGVAGVLNSTVPLLAMTIGILFFKARTTTKKVVGIGVGFVGALWLVALSPGQQTAQPIYAAACIMAATMYAVNANIIGANLRKFHPLSIGATAFFISSPFYLLGVWRSGAMERVWMPENRAALGAVFYLAVASTVMASAVYTWLVQRTSPVFATSVAYLFPIVSLALGTFDGEPLGWTQGIGAAIILVGLFLSRH